MRSRSSLLVEAEPERSRTPVSGGPLGAEGRSSSPLTFLCWEKLHAIRGDILEELHKGIGRRGEGRRGLGLHLSEDDPSEIVPSCHLPVCLARVKMTWQCQGGICSGRRRLIWRSRLIDLIRRRRSE